MGATLVIIKTSTGKTFGGFTTANWDSHADKHDTKSFVFSVDKFTKYPVLTNFETAIHCNPTCGPIFGGWSVVSENGNRAVIAIF
jgi:hypothetical protein